MSEFDIPFARIPVYFSEMDNLEYVTVDDVTVIDYIDEFLSIIYDSNGKKGQIVGARIHGLKQALTDQGRYMVDYVQELEEANDMYLNELGHLSQKLERMEARPSARYLLIGALFMAAGSLIGGLLAGYVNYGL